ncbi:MAG: class I SAM-dependent methyltransferase [Thermoleophilia bacterium]|nr:class I SAM-dependent methyltransferase [Thermoleophilia bacterium]
MTDGVRTVDEFYERAEMGATDLDARMQVFLAEYRRHRAGCGERPLRVLDVGCGRRPILARHVEPSDEYCGCDIVAPEEELPCFRRVNLNDESLAKAFEGDRFDVVFCGEVVEHVFSPDALLDDIRRLLRADGLLVLSTPNLAYWVNRLLLLVGVSPLFVENSARVKLGRRFRFLGQGNDTQGHIRLFTYRAMRDLFDLQGWRLVRVHPLPVWPFPIDRLICRVSASLAPDVVYVARPG